MSLLLAGCSDETSPGKYHETLCRTPFVNEDFLTSALQEWEERVPGGGSFALELRGQGADRDGWLTITAQAGDLSEGDRSAYGLVHVGPSEDFHLRAQLTDAPAGSGQLCGILAQASNDTLVAVGLRGDGGGAAAELLGFSEGAPAFSAQGGAVETGSVLLELIRDRDEWIARVAGAEVGRGTLALDPYAFDVGIYVGSTGSAATLRVEWIDACPYYREVAP
jgi:hypothetical protein